METSPLRKTYKSKSFISFGIKSTAFNISKGAGKLLNLKNGDLIGFSNGANDSMFIFKVPKEDNKKDFVYKFRIYKQKKTEVYRISAYKVIDYLRGKCDWSDTVTNRYNILPKLLKIKVDGKEYDAYQMIPDFKFKKP